MTLEKDSLGQKGLSTKVMAGKIFIYDPKICSTEQEPSFHADNTRGCPLYVQSQIQMILFTLHDKPGEEVSLALPYHWAS